MRPDRILQLLAMLALCLAWLVPNHYQPWYSFYNETAAFVALFLIVAALFLGGRRQPFPAIVWIVLAVALVPWLQTAFGLLRFSGDAWVGTLYVFALAVSIGAGSGWASRDPTGAAAALAATTLVGAVVSSWLAVGQIVGATEDSFWIVGMVPGGQPVGNLGHWNLLANLIGTGAVCLLMLYEQRRLTTVSASILLAVLVVGLGVTQSRTALVFGPVVGIGIGLARRRGIAFRTSVWVVVVATAAYWIVAAAAPAIQSALLLSAPDSLVVRGVSTPRWQMWRMLLDAASRSPWFGYGWLQVGAAELAVVNRYPPINELWVQGHDLFLELILWCGFPLGMVLGGALIFWFVDRAARVRTLESASAMLVIALLGAHSLVEFPYQYAYFLIPAGLWIGQVEHAVGGRHRASSSVNSVVGALTLALAVGIAWDYMAVEEDFQLVRFQGKRIGPVTGVDTTPHAPFLSGLTAFLHASRSIPVRGMSDAEIARLEAVVERYPYPAGLARLARALVQNGRAVEARERFISIRQMFGDGTYVELRRDLRERADAGESGTLLELDRSLPD